MPIFKIKASKATPHKAIEYITNPHKAAAILSIGLDDMRPYAEQFQETADLWGKAHSKDSRKYYHCKLSFSPEDCITVDQALKIAEEHTLATFPNNECVIAVHTDKAHMHAHIIVNSVCFDSGKMLHMRLGEFADMKDLSNTLSAKEGFSTVDFRTKRSAHTETLAERHIRAKGGEPWKDELRAVIDEAKTHCRNMKDFEAWLGRYGVRLGRNTEKTISYIHPTQGKAVRGGKLGEAYTAEAIRGALAAARIEEPPKPRRIDGELLNIAQHVFAHTARGQSQEKQKHIGRDLSAQARKEKAIEERDNGHER